MKKLTNTEINMQMLKILINQLKPSEIAECIFSSDKCYKIQCEIDKMAIAHNEKKLNEWKHK